MVVNPNGRYHSKSASKQIKIIDISVIVFGFLSKTINTKQKRKSGKTCLFGFRPVGVNASITKAVPTNRKTTFANTELYLDIASLNQQH